MRYAVWRNAIFEDELKLSLIYGFRVYAFREVTTGDDLRQATRREQSVSTPHVILRGRCDAYTRTRHCGVSFRVLRAHTQPKLRYSGSVLVHDPDEVLGRGSFT